MATLNRDGWIKTTEIDGNFYDAWVSDEDYDQSAEENKKYARENGYKISYKPHYVIS